MALVTKSIKGTQDTLPSESYKIQFVEQSVLEIAKNYGYKEIRVPVFEHTELFQRGVGDTTDVVQKEMYTFNDKGDRSITLRPEGTAGVVRAVVENGLLNDALPLKVSYLVSCFRYEKPQAGRLREFHQFGAEMFGSASPAADAQMIAMVKDIFDFLGIGNISLEINSIGCPECRKRYNEALKAFFAPNLESLCYDCKTRFEKNPLRLLDCKEESCKKINVNAPSILDSLCEDCSTHFEELKEFVRTAQFDRMGAFTYSEEEGTYGAENFKDSISAKVKQERLDELMTLQSEISLAFNQSRVGSEIKVIVDDFNDGVFVCRSEFESPEVDGEILVKYDSSVMADVDPYSLVGEFMSVKVVGADEYDLIAEPVEIL